MFTTNVYYYIIVNILESHKSEIIRKNNNRYYYQKYFKLFIYLRLSLLSIMKISMNSNIMISYYEYY